MLILPVLLAPASLRAGDWVEMDKILADDGLDNDHFSSDVSIDADTALVGASDSDTVEFGSDSGRAYVFTRSGGTWAQQGKLLPDDGNSSDYFGFSVSVSGDTALVGAYGDDDNGNSSGSAYVFTRNDGVWTQQAKLLPDDGVAVDYFAFSVSLDGDTALVGAYRNDDNGTDSGSVYVFARIGGDWVQQAKLLPGDGAAQDRFGYSVSLSGDTALVGAFLDDDKGSSSGSAYVFTRNGNAWTQQAKLVAADGAANDYFGYSVSISADTALVGARFDDDNGSASGSAYVFTRNGEDWTQQAKLVASDGDVNDTFGESVGIWGDTAVIGAYQDDDNGDDSGSAYVFMRSGTAWTQQPKLVASDGATGDWMGKKMSISGNTALAGALDDDDNGVDSGSAYFLELQSLTEPTDIILSNASIAEHEPTGALIGTLGVVDADDTTGFTYALVTGYGDDDNGIFSLGGAGGDELFASAVFDYETKTSYRIRLRVTDDDSNTHEEDNKISVINITTDDDDNDGLIEADEIVAGTHKLRPDTDGDGTSDGDEVNYWMTDPTSSSSAFKVAPSSLDTGANTLTLDIPTVDGITYYFEGSNDVLADTWNPVSGTVSGTGLTKSKVIDLSVYPYSFFRVYVFGPAP